MSESMRLSGKLLVLPAEGWVYYPCVCGHARAAHDGHTHTPDNPEPTHCSQGCGCKAFTPVKRWAPRPLAAECRARQALLVRE